MFYSDAPISSNSSDLLKRGGFAQLLATAICNLGRLDTFTIGLYGKWGSGKTSVVNMMLQALEEIQKESGQEEKILIVRFEPWNISDSNQLLSQFLVRLSNEFQKKRDKNLKPIGDALEAYSDAFALAELIPSFGLTGKIVSLLGKSSLSFLGKQLKPRVESKDIQKQKEYVTSLLADQPNRILVVIDDIDRLSNDQIRQVFQLVTSVANFPKTTYLLVFDKEIVVKALECVQEGSGEDYLEKIIQMPVQIPGIQKSEIQKILFERLDNIADKYPNILFSQDRWHRLFMLCVNPIVKQIRDVNRLCNSIEFKLSAISEEVNLTDLIALTSLELGMPALYEWIKDSKVTLTGYGSEEDFDFTSRNQKEWYAFYEQILIERLCNGERNSANIKKVESALKILSYLFPHFGGKIGKTSEVFALDLFRKNGQIAHPDKFDRYFHLTVDYIANRRSEITTAAYLLNANAVVSVLLQKDSEGACCDFLEEIRALHAELPAERARVLIEALLTVGNSLDSSNNRSLFTVKAQDYAEHILYKLFNQIPEHERLPYWLELIASADGHKLAVLANILNQLELGYGRLAANGVERSEYNKLLSVAELEMVENAFVEQAKIILAETNLFDFKEWRRVTYLLENFDSDYISSYLEDKFTEDGNVLKYLTGFIVKWIGAGVSYEVNKDYEKRLTDERILQAINSQKQNGNLFKLAAEVQYACAAFCLCMNYTPNTEYEVSQEAVEKTLLTWKQEVHTN